MSTTMKFDLSSNTNFEYDVVLSFAEENRKFVEVVAFHLKRNKVKVYYDNDERIDAWGKDIYIHLSDIYKNKARFCVMFISKHYKQKYWTQHEQMSAQARQLIEAKRAYILPFRIDNTQIDGLHETRAFLSINMYNERKLAEAIIEKLKIERAFPNIKPIIDQKIGLLWYQKISRQLQHKTRFALLLLIIASTLAFILRDRFTPVKELTKRIHERSRISDSTICKDGWHSPSHGSGTCSSHHGIDHNMDSLIYSKTLEQSEKEAEDISWLE